MAWRRVCTLSGLRPQSGLTFSCRASQLFISVYFGLTWLDVFPGWFSDFGCSGCIMILIAKICPSASVPPGRSPPHWGNLSTQPCSLCLVGPRQPFPHSTSSGPPHSQRVKIAVRATDGHGMERGIYIQKAWLLCLVLPQSVISGSFLTSLSLAFFICKMGTIKVL